MNNYSTVNKDKKELIHPKNLGEISEVITASEQITSDWVSEGLKPTKVSKNVSDKQSPKDEGRFLNSFI